MADSDTDLDSDPNPAEVVADEVDSTEVDSLGQDGKEKIDQEVLQTIPVTITVQVGRASLKIRDLLKLTRKLISNKTISDRLKQISSNVSKNSILMKKIQLTITQLLNQTFI